MDGNEACEVALGSLLVSLLDPTPGREVEFHRWYERDHFYAGCMIGPWFFAGRRFVATGALKDLRFPAQGGAFPDLRLGSYLALYYLLAGHHDEAERWAVAQVNRLIANGRMLPSRRAVHAGFYRYRWGAFRDRDGVPAELALDHPYPGLALLLLERAPGVDAPALERWYREEYLPRRRPDSPAAMRLAFDPLRLPDDAPAYVQRPSELERRALHLVFLEADPREPWRALFEPEADGLRDSGLGRVAWAAPFVPTIPGSDRYTDELW
jgi:hypothetical protein